MPAMTVLHDRLFDLYEQATKRLGELREEFLKVAAVDPAAAIDRFGMELAETDYFCRLLDYAERHTDTLRGVLEHSESVILRGDWQPVSPCAMHRALHQAQSLARCKFIKRLREVLKDGTD